MSNGEVDVAHSPPFDILRFKPPLPLLLIPVPRERLLLGFVYPFGRPRADALIVGTSRRKANVKPEEGPGVRAGLATLDDSACDHGGVGVPCRALV